MKNNVEIAFDDGRVMSVYRGTTVREVLKEINDEQIIALRIDGAVVNADYEINDDAFANCIRATDAAGKKIYIKGLEYVYIKAVKDIFGKDAVVNVKHSLDKALYTEITTKKSLNTAIVKQIKNRMKEICRNDYPFKQINVSRSDAYDYVKNLHEEEKELNYTYMTDDSVTMYELDDEYNYFFYIMPPSTGYLKRFDLTYVGGKGVMLSYPINNIVPKYVPTPKVLKAFKDAEEKLNHIGIRYVGDLNKLITEGKISDIIQMNEIIYDNNIQDIAKKVVDSKTIRAVFISGPSSSGKTTSSKKLSMHLNALGKETFVISTDDYFLEREQSPRKADGSYEFEIVDALDIKLFNKQLRALLNGEEVSMPTFNFITGKKEYKRKPVSLKKDQILIVEGLHAVSEKLNCVIPKKNKLKIYISPFTPVAIDRHNHISTTDVRLLRRMVRDYNHRGYSAEATLTSWMGMRASEENYVYPYQRQADVVINTSLGYEIGVLRTFAEPLLYSIDKDSLYYEEAIRILQFLEKFLTIPSDYVPNISVLREFIGGSYFE